LFASRQTVYTVRGWYLNYMNLCFSCISKEIHCKCKVSNTLKSLWNAVDIYWYMGFWEQDFYWNPEAFRVFSHYFRLYDFVYKYYGSVIVQSVW